MFLSQVFCHSNNNKESINKYVSIAAQDTFLSFVTCFKFALVLKGLFAE